MSQFLKIFFAVAVFENIFRKKIPIYIYIDKFVKLLQIYLYKLEMHFFFCFFAKNVQKWPKIPQNKFENCDKLKINLKTATNFHFVTVFKNIFAFLLNTKTQNKFENCDK